MQNVNEMKAAAAAGVAVLTPFGAEFGGTKDAVSE